MITGPQLKALRLSAGFTQKALAAKLGKGNYSFQTVSGVENGSRNIGLNLLRDWANACGYDVSISFTKQGSIDSPDDGGDLILPDDFNESD